MWAGKIKYFFKFLLLYPAVFLLFIFPIELFAASVKYYADGKLGQFGGQIAARYVSVAAEKGIAVSDISILGFEFIFPSSESYTLKAGYKLEQNDSLFHDFSVTTNIYTASSVNSPNECNPDGKIGAPIFLPGFSVKMADSSPEDLLYRLSLGISLPISANLTLGAGCNYYRKNKSKQADNYFGVINFFPVKYTKGREFENPDGVDGIPSFAFRGGGSKDGIFGQLEIIVPLKSSLSIGFLLRGERMNAQDITRAALGGRVSFYPGN